MSLSAWLCPALTRADLPPLDLQTNQPSVRTPARPKVKPAVRPREGAPLVRIATVVNAEGPLQADFARLIGCVAHNFDTVTDKEYRAMARGLGMRLPFSSKAAWTIGHALHATHVLLLQHLGPDSAAGTVLVRLIDMRTGELLVRTRQHVREGRLVPAFVDGAAGQICRASLISPEAQRADTRPFPHSDMEDTKPISAGSGEGSQKDEDEPTDSKKPSADRAPTAASNTEASPERVLSAQRTQIQKIKPHLEAGVTVARRRATLRPHLQEGEAPPCFCNGAGYAPPFASAHVAAYWPLSALNSRLSLLAAVDLGHAAQSSTTVHSGASMGGAALFFETLLSYALVRNAWCAVSVDAGYFYRLYDLSDGPFVALVRGGPQFGLEGRFQLLRDRLSLEVRTDIDVVTHQGREAKRLGRLTRGLGFVASLGPRLALGRFFVSASVRFEQASLRFKGPTALYAATLLQDVRLTDSTLGLLVAAGLRL